MSEDFLFHTVVRWKNVKGHLKLTQEELHLGSSMKSDLSYGEDWTSTHNSKFRIQTTKLSIQGLKFPNWKIKTTAENRKRFHQMEPQIQFIERAMENRLLQI